jgi:hypothetical protein
MTATDLIREPVFRRLRIFAFDPALSAQFDTSGIGEITIAIPWEKDLRPGPVGEYIEVVDWDPASGFCYKPIDLNHPRVLAQEGLAPSESNPQFHQQMVYAVAMTTIGHFERALGRVALWSSHRDKGDLRLMSSVKNVDGIPIKAKGLIIVAAVRNVLHFRIFDSEGDKVVDTDETNLTSQTERIEDLKKQLEELWSRDELTEPEKDRVIAAVTSIVGKTIFREWFVKRLRIYPHALRNRNAFYSPDRKALLFGYFPVNIRDANNMPGTIVYTCLSHDIIAHETTHALLDGVHPRFNEPTNADVLAFHEAFADIVAMFQHFSYPGVLHDQIARTRGDLAGENLLGQLAQQFGRASGRGRALRDALGSVNKATQKWEPHTPDVRALDKAREPHSRGAILVAAVFGAFLKVYRSRTVDLYRIASEGTGVLREGDIHPDLAGRLADEAARCAQQTLLMCIRAIDYCPPVGITFGDYLRGIITADFDFNPDDPFGYRLAFVESFRQWGIYPEGMCSMSVEALLWPTWDAAREEAGVPIDAREIRSLFSQLASKLANWNLESDRYQTWEGVDKNSVVLWKWLMEGKARGNVWRPMGLVHEDDHPPPTVFRSMKSGRVAVEVHSVRTALRRSPRGAPSTDLVVEITQRRRGYFDKGRQKEMDERPDPLPEDAPVDFKYRAGCTLLINPLTMEVRRVIRTPGDIACNQQLERIRRFLTEGGLESDNAFDYARQAIAAREPFALLHRDEEA